MKKIYLLSILAVSLLILASCGQGPKALPKDGWVKFSLDGQPHTLTQMRLAIQPNNAGSISAMKRAVVPIAHGKTDFAFYLVPLMEYIDDVYAKTKKSPEEYFEASWFEETEDPVNYLRQGKRISSENGRDYLLDVRFPGKELSTRRSDPRNPTAQENAKDWWIAIDEVTDQRAKGRFGGNIYLKQGGWPPASREIGIVDGQFDVPIAKLYSY